MSEQEAGAASSVAYKERAESLVLIVDDDPAVREWLGSVLSLEGYRVMTAYDGPSALEMCESHRPDVILLDVMMPKMSGLEVLDVLHDPESAYDGSVPVILLSALGSDQDHWEGYRRGAAFYLPKPLEPTALVSVVEQVIG